MSREGIAMCAQLDFTCKAGLAVVDEDSQSCCENSYAIGENRSCQIKSSPHPSQHLFLIPKPGC